jgi:hypothetical protein
MTTITAAPLAPVDASDLQDPDRLARWLARATATARAQHRELTAARHQIRYLEEELTDAATTEEHCRRALVDVRQLADGALSLTDPAALVDVLHRVCVLVDQAVTPDPAECAHPGVTTEAPCVVCGRHDVWCTCPDCCDQMTDQADPVRPCRCYPIGGTR